VCVCVCVCDVWQSILDLVVTHIEQRTHLCVSKRESVHVFVCVCVCDGQCHSHLVVH